MRLDQSRIFSMLGLATKAGKTTSGEFSTEKAIKANKAAMVIVTEDASDNTKKHFSDMCRYRNIPFYVFGERDILGHAMGKEMRVSLAITDKGFARTIQKLLEEN